jgi:hypothetical protein
VNLGGDSGEIDRAAAVGARQADRRFPDIEFEQRQFP